MRLLFPKYSVGFAFMTSTDDMMSSFTTITSPNPKPTFTFALGEMWGGSAAPVRCLFGDIAFIIVAAWFKECELSGTDWEV